MLYTIQQSHFSFLDKHPNKERATLRISISCSLSSVKSEMERILRMTPRISTSEMPQFCVRKSARLVCALCIKRVIARPKTWSLSTGFQMERTHSISVCKKNHCEYYYIKKKSKNVKLNMFFSKSSTQVPEIYGKISCQEIKQRALWTNFILAGHFQKNTDICSLKI